MARNPQFSSGTISGTTNRATLAALIRSKLASVISNGEAAWQLADTPAANKYVYHSVGDRNLGSGANKGDTDIWILIDESVLQPTYYPYYDWSPTSHTGHQGALTARNGLIQIDDTTDVKWICVVDEYSFWMFTEQGATHYFLGFGLPLRNIVPELAGVGRLVSDLSDTGEVTVTVDRDLTGQLRVKQKLHIMNQTPDGEALEDAHVDVVTLEEINGTSLTLSGVTQSFSAGSLVGLDAIIAVVIYEGSTEAWVCNSIRGRLYPAAAFCRYHDCGEMSLADMDPTPNGFYIADAIALYDGAYMDGQQVRATLPYVISADCDLMAHGDTLVVDKGPDTEYYRVTLCRMYNQTDLKFAVGPWPSTSGTEYPAMLYPTHPDDMVWQHQGYIEEKEAASASAAADIASVVSTSSTSWRVTFTVPVLDNAALRNALNYEFSPALSVVSVTPESATNPSYVDLETTEQKDAETYTLTIHLVEAAP